MQKATKTAKFKSGLVGIVVGVASATSLFITACPPLPDKFSVTPLISPLVVDEGKPVEARFRIVGGTIDDIVTSNANSPDYHQFEFSNVPPDEILVTGLPIDSNKNGPSNLEVELTDLDGKKAYSKLPIEIVDTIDVTFFGFPNELHGKKGIPIHSISGDLLDDYSQFGNGLGVEITSPHYTVQNVVYIGANRFSFSLIPKELFEGETYVLIKGFDDEGNVEYLQIPMYITGFTNFAPVISAENFSTKEGGQGSFGVNIIDDEDPLSKLKIRYRSDDFNLSHELVNENLVTIYYSAKDYYQFGPATIEITAEDTKGAISEKIINVTIQPMTDLELNVEGQYLTVDEVVIGHNTVPLANAAVRVYKREINWVEKEEYGDLYHFRMGVNSNLGELLYEGTTDSQGNIKFKVDPQKEDENLLYLVLSKEGFLDKTRHLFGDEDLEAKTLILSQDNEEMNSWLYYKLCNHGYQPMDVHAYLQGCNVSLPYQIYENSLLPEIVVVIKDDEYVASEVLNAIPVAMKYLLGEGVKISYAKERGVVQDNKFYIEFWDEPGGQAWINMVPLSNLVRVSGMYIDRNYRGERTMSVFVHEGGHALIFVNAHEEDSNSQYGDDENFINYPYFSGSDNAVQSLILDVVGNIMPGDKYDFENGIFKQESLSAEKDGYIYYIHLE